MSTLQPWITVCSFACQTGKGASTKQERIKKVPEGNANSLLSPERKNIHYHEKKKGQTTDNTIDTVIKPLVNRIPLRVYTEVR